MGEKVQTKHDLVSELEALTRDCTRMFLTGREKNALKKFDDTVEKIMTALIVYPETLEACTEDTPARLRRFQFGLYLEFKSLAGGAGIKRRGGR